MKQFLLDQFNNYNQATVDKFQENMVGPLPTFSKPKAWDPDTNIWGYELNGFWYTNKDQTYFFEENGTVHTLGIIYKPEYYKLCETLYQENKKNPICDVMVPLEMSTEVITADYHLCGIPAGGNIYYMKFETPNKVYGQNIMARLDPNFNNKLYFQNYIDQLINVFFIFRRIDLAVVSEFNFFNFFVTPTGNFFMFTDFCHYNINYKIDGIVLIFTHIKEKIEKLENHMSDRLEKNLIELTSDDKQELISYARNKLYGLIINEELPKIISKLSTGLSVQLSNITSRLSNIVDSDVTRIEKELSRIDKFLPVDQLCKEIGKIDNMLRDLKTKCQHLAN